MAVIPTLPFYVEERFGLSDPEAVRGWCALIYGAAPGTAALFSPFWGALGDRVGRKAMVLRSMLAIGVVMMLMPLAPDPYSLTALRVLQGMFAGYIAPAMALVTADAPVARQGRTIGRLQVALAIGLAVGPPLGAEVAAWFGRPAVFRVAGALSLLSAVPVALLVRERRARVPASGHGLLRDYAADLGAVLASRPFAALLALLVVIRLAMHMVEPFVALWVRELGPLPWIVAAGQGRQLAVDRTTALAFTILAFAQILVTTSWGRLADRVGPLRCLAAVSLAVAAILWLTGLVATIEQYLALRCAAALFMAGSLTLSYAAVAGRVPARRRALAFGLAQSCFQLGLALGPMLGAAVSRGAGLRILFPVAGSILAAAGLGAVILERPRGRST